MAPIIPIIGAAIIGLITSCNPLGDGTYEVVTGNHYVIEENVAFEGDLVHGDRLDTIMDPSGDPQLRCDHMGGAFVAEHTINGEPVGPACLDGDK